ncbi:MAG: hypothetical protein QM752_02745 [Gammaproteobacteria bacterium]
MHAAMVACWEKFEQFKIHLSLTLYDKEENKVVSRMRRRVVRFFNEHKEYTPVAGNDTLEQKHERLKQLEADHAFYDKAELGLVTLFSLLYTFQVAAYAHMQASFEINGVDMTFDGGDAAFLLMNVLVLLACEWRQKKLHEQIQPLQQAITKEEMQSYVDGKLDERLGKKETPTTNTSVENATENSDFDEGSPLII